MKLRSISLTNIRRFAGQTATLDGIGDGITVLAEPNEFGKSTFFDALHALFFERHRSKVAAVKSLQPHSGATPEVAVEVDTKDGRFRLEKRWLSRASARVLDATGRIVAQDDEAEAWIDRLIDGGLSGPSGLLWVRQGLLGLEPEGSSAAERNERESLLATRRGLLSSVAGEIDMMTGGRRMDAVLARSAAELDRLATSQLRPKAGGEWHRAQAEVKALEDREALLAPKAAALSGALRERREAERQRSALDDPEAEATRQASLREARAAHEAALAHAEQVERARQAVQMAVLTGQGARRDLEALDALAGRLVAAEARQAAAAGEVARLATAAQAARDEDRNAAAAGEAARAAVAGLRSRLQLAQRAALAAKAAQAVTSLRDAIQRAEAFRSRKEAAEARAAALPVTPKALAAAEAAAAERDRLTAIAGARAVTMHFAYSGAARALQDGAPVLEPLRLTGRSLLDLPGLGQLAVDPGERAEDDLPARLSAAESALARALVACAAETLAEARQKLTAATSAREESRQAAELLANTAPQGIEALRQSLARAETEAGSGGAEAEDPALLEPLLQAAEAAEAGALATARGAHQAAVEAGDRLARAEAADHAARAALDTARAEAGDPALHASRSAEARTRLAEAETLRTEREAALQTLIAAAPDLDTALARRDRAQSVVDLAARDRTRLAQRIAELEGAIRIQADAGIEEELEEVRGALPPARARAARYEAEVMALARLRRALEEARVAARDAYFGPVTQELAPLLAILHDGAELHLDDRTLLPAALHRNGVAEDLAVLSGGTREQLAILTRLAFARLFARNGQPVPLILDDALVHSDDARIEAMFTALHRVAKDQQILVLTCRQRAFAGLGGERAVVRIGPA
ncbi:AAA family ATPase [Cereibacter changlensis]|uniref:AAA family ATPase n=1 Tax=Cereibacter changlensis TaxID=402884 RepID=UPI00403368B4